MDEPLLVCQWPKCGVKFGVDPDSKVCRPHKAQWDEFGWLLNHTMVRGVPVAVLLSVVRASIQVEEKPSGIIVPGLGEDIQQATRDVLGGTK